MFYRGAVLVVAAAIAAAIAPAQTVVVGRGDADRISWGLCAGAPCVAGSDLTVPYISTGRYRFRSCSAAAKTGPVGASFAVDILVGGASIFGAGPKLEIAAGATTGKIKAFASPLLNEDDIVRIDITSVGATVAGQDVFVTCVLVDR